MAIKAGGFLGICIAMTAWAAMADTGQTQGQQDDSAWLEGMATTPSARTEPQSARPRDDAGARAGMADLVGRLGRLWKVNCDIPGVRRANIMVVFRLSSNGQVVDGPRWGNPRSDAVLEAVYQTAVQAIRRGEPYLGLDPGLYNKTLEVQFSAASVCRYQ